MVEMKDAKGLSAARSAASFARESVLRGVAGGELLGVPILENEYDEAPGLASRGCCESAPAPPTSDPGERGGLGELLRARRAVEEERESVETGFGCGDSSDQPEWAPSTISANSSAPNASSERATSSKTDGTETSIASPGESRWSGLNWTSAWIGI